MSSGERERIRIGDRVSIQRRGSKGIWIADYWQGGQHRKTSLRTANKKVAVEKATKLAGELVGGTFQQPPPAVTIRAAVDDYLSYLQTEDRARKTIVKYRGVFDRFLGYLQQHRVTHLAQVTASHFDKYRTERKQTRHRKTLYVEGVIIKQLFNWSRRRKLILEDPLADVKLHKPPLEPKGGPSLEQVNAILFAVEEPLRSQLSILALTGMRSGELQRLRLEDIDLPGGWVHVRSRQGAETKTRQSRKVPIHPRVRSVLESLMPKKGPWLFTAAASPKYPRGDHEINVKRLNEQFSRLIKRLGMTAGRESGFVIHSLRHFFETFCVNAGIPQRVIDTWLGHRSDKSMAAVYYRLRDEDSQAFMSKVPFGVGSLAADSDRGDA